MVNWTIISQVYDRLEGYDDMGHYGKGSWAPALVFHDGTYYVYFCSPDEGLFMSTATDPHGPWAPLRCVKNIKGWEDPYPFWDDNGQAYLGHSLVGAGPIIIHKMSADGRTLQDDGMLVYTGYVAEGTKFLKRDGWYYLVIPEGGVGTGWQTVLRSKDIYGPYEKKVILEQGTTEINGPHQGNLVDTPNGEWWLFHFQNTPGLGRVTHLEPVQWIDGWPMAGVDVNMNGIGEPVYVYRKPNVSAADADLKSASRESGISNPLQRPSLPQHSDEFTEVSLGLQWQWNHNPVDDHWSLTEKKGWLTLKALEADQVKNARNTITQKTMGYEGKAVTQLDASALAEGTRAGLCALGGKYAGIGVTKQNGKLQFYSEVNGKVELLGTAPKTAYLKVHAEGYWFTFSYSTDGKNYKEAGKKVGVRSANWKGPRLGLYCYGPQGKANFNYFHYDILK